MSQHRSLCDKYIYCNLYQLVITVFFKLIICLFLCFKKKLILQGHKINCVIMKNLVLLGILLLWFVSLFGQTEVKSNLDKVTIYPQKALVEKSVKVNLKKGENRFIITNNAYYGVEEDVHFASSNDWFVTSINTQIQTLPQKEAAKKVLPQNIYQQYIVLKDNLDDTEAQITDAEALLKTLYAQKTALSNLKATKTPSEIDTIEIIKSQFVFQREEMKNINKLISQTTEKQTELKYQKNNILKDIEILIKKYVGGKKVLTQDKSILVSIYSNKDLTNQTLKYTYFTHAVSSSYSYDVMFDENKNTAVFYLKNTVTQNTGENWKDCEIVFSTSEGEYVDYNENLSPYYLDYAYTKQKAKVGTMKLNTATDKAVAMGSKSEVEGEAVYLANAIYSQSDMQNLTLNREYSLATKQNIATNESITIPLYNEETKVDFSRFSTPKNTEKVYYTALLPEWEDLGLLNTYCNIYLNDKFIANTYINTDEIGDTMRLSVGEDKEVKITRKLRKSSPAEKGFLSKDVVEKAQIILIVKNTKNELVKLSIKDQIPISANSEIKVSDIVLDNGEIEANSGIVNWNVEIEPKGEKKITISYTVTYPKGNKVILN